MNENIKGILLLEDTPNNTEIGIDMKFFVASSNFRGIKSIPPGPHLVYSRHSGSCGPRSSFMIEIKPSSEEYFVKLKWSKQAEEFVPETLTDSELDRLKSNFAEMERYMAAYPHDEYRNWISLTNFLNFPAFEALFPSDKQLYSCDMLQSKASSSQQRLAQPNSPAFATLETIPGTEVRFTDIPKRPIALKNASFDDVSRRGMDRSDTLEYVFTLLSERHTFDEEFLEHYHLKTGECAFLAELQFSFITFLIVERIDSWLHWRDMLTLATNCKVAVKSHPEFFSHLISVLFHQLNRDSNSDFDKASDTLFSMMAEASTFGSSKPSEPYFIPHMIKQLCLNVNDAATESHNARLSDLCARVDGLRVAMEQHYGWELVVPNSTVVQADSNGDLSEIPVTDIDWDTEDAPTIVL
ncbi:a1-alpha2 repression [Cichlidogyrus casuarinus]|uniref:Protein AAR2 homolog n=1 Tax=Cichlidogyrus casuarinus TaxID=1844966 RepID=A0ABD2PS60_9PLAT